MRLLAAVLGCVLWSSAAAVAYGETLHVAPFNNRCFDAAQLSTAMAARGVRLEVGETRVGQEVHVTSASDGLDVRITARDATGREIGVEMRHVADGPCDALLETVGLIVLRAATPLHFMPPAPPPKPKPRPKPSTVEQTPVEPPPAEETPPPPQREAQAVDIRSVIPQRVVTHAAVESSPPPRVAHVHMRPRVELAVRGEWLFALDHAPSEPAGTLELGVRWSQRLGLAVRAGVAKDWRSINHSGDSSATLDVRRIPLALLLGIDAPLRHGAFRVDVGPLVDLWRVAASGVSIPATTWLAQPGLLAGVSYRYTVRRVFFMAGVDVQVAVLRHDLVVTGVGTVSHTPLVDLAPYIGLGVTL